jgi:hypothetical protein
MPEVLLEVDEPTFRYGTCIAVDGASLTIRTGEMLRAPRAERRRQ